MATLQAATTKGTVTLTQSVECLPQTPTLTQGREGWEQAIISYDLQAEANDLHRPASKQTVNTEHEVPPPSQQTVQTY